MAGSSKIDFRRELRGLYSAGKEPSLIDVPEMAFLMIDGHGDPNTVPEYREAVQALFTVSYTAKFAVKRAGGPDFGVMPLEGLWWVPDMGQFSMERKADWDWTAMIMQPDPVDADVVEAAIEQAGKKPIAALPRLRYEHWREGEAAQVMHVGPYADEGPTIAGLHAFIADQERTRAGKHHEIYLKDPSRTAPENLKTIIRQPVAH